jgi:DNA helicase-2/ATP-dependent DNA helicase PcrA
VDDEGELEEERRLCYVALTRAQEQLVLTSAARRRVFGEYQPSAPSRFFDEIPADLVDQRESPYLSSWQSSRQAAGASRAPLGPRRGGAARGRDEESPAYRYEDEDQSQPGLRLGMRVRHPMFGLGTVVAVEPAVDDVKVTVRFASVGAKRLLARYARLEPA